MLTMRQPLRDSRKRGEIARPRTTPAPVGGVNAVSALASMPKEDAVSLLNWFPRPDSVEIRRGQKVWATDVGTSASEVESLMVYNGLTANKMFGAISTTIYDVTANAAATSAVTTQTNGRWQHVNFSNEAGNYLLCVNGANAYRSFDGTSWDTPTVTGFSGSDAIHINVHKRRVWFVKNQSAEAYYLAVDAIAGAATKFDFGPVFSDGGYLMGTATWTRDGGAGSDDVLVAISSAGQVALYSGTDPDSALTWDLVGVFRVGAPIGRRCFTKWGADLVILTIDGAYPLSKLLSVDAAERDRVALSRKIGPALASDARAFGSNYGWEPIVYPRGTRLIVNVPTIENSVARQWVMNTLTGAWCEFDAHNANCWAVFNDKLYFGTSIGTVVQADIGSVDIDKEIVAVGQTAYDPHGSAHTKRFVLSQPLITSEGANRPSIGISVDFEETSRMTTQTATQTTGATWDGGFTWDGGAVWGGSDVLQINDWLSQSALGKFASIRFIARTGSNLTANDGNDEVMRINGFVLLAEQGGLL